MSLQDPIEQNIEGVRQLVGSRINKINTGSVSQMEGVEGDFEDEFTLKLSDEELLNKANQIENNYLSYEAAINIRQQAQKTYYLGRQKESGTIATTNGQPISPNLIFEAEETFLPAALSKNPEPVVWSDNSPEGNKISDSVKAMLQYHADTLVLRRKLSKTVRKWSVDFLGVLKHGWDEKLKDITLDVRDAKKFVFEKDGYIDEYGDYIGTLGERVTVSAAKLIERNPDHAAYITIMVNGKLGTDVTYTEWWSDEYTFETFKGKVLYKAVNPHYNPDKEVEELDEFSIPQKNVQKGLNHFGKQKKPYTFLSVFSLDDQPHDITGLIEQNIPNQRRVTRRTEQIDYNLSRANNSDIFSQNNFNQETGKQAAEAMAKGNPVLVPQGGPIGDAIHRLPAPGLDGSFFNELENSKQDLRSIFGTQGISAQGPDQETKTARGMILNQQFDSSRIGGGIGDAIEQVADNIFNWWVQLYYVYYDEPHYAMIMGQQKAVEYITLSSQDLNRRLVISVSPDSMKPHDEITDMNQALSLWEAGVLDPKTLMTRLNFPDPQETAENTVLWLLDKNAYLQLNFPELAQKLAQLQQQAQAQAVPTQGSPQEGQPIPGEQESTLAGGAIEASPQLSQVPINTQALPQ